MSPDEDRDPAAGLGRRWVRTYNEFLFAVMALRCQREKGWPAGTIREVLTGSARRLVEATDELDALGRPPWVRFAGGEAELWARTVEYVSALPWDFPPDGLAADLLLADLAEMARGWEAFAGFVARLPDGCFAHIPALDPASLRPDGVARLLDRPAAGGRGRQRPGESRGEGDPFAVVAD